MTGSAAWRGGVGRGRRGGRWQFLRSAARPAGGGKERAPDKALRGGPNRCITGRWSEEEDHIRRMGR